MSSRARQLVDEHWDGYIKPLLEAHGHSEDIIRIVAFHYKSSGIHFYKHAVEDIRHGEAERETPPLPDPWDRCKCGNVVAECCCPDPIAHLDRNVKVGNPSLCGSCDNAQLCGPLTDSPPSTCAGYEPNGS